MSTKDLQGLADVGEVDMFGLNEFGEAEGLPALYGVAAGAVLSGAGPALVRWALPSQREHSELWGFGAGVGVGALMAIMRSTRNAGWACMLTAGIASGLRLLENWFSGSAPKLDGVTFERRKVLQGVVVENRPTLGLTTTENQPTLSGPPQLVGSGVQLVGNHGVQIQGGPAVSGVAGLYGSTYMNRV